MPTFVAGQVVELVDNQGRRLGTFEIADVTDAIVLGTFVAGADYAHVAPTFAKFEELVNAQVFSLLDEVEDRIASLEVRALAPGDSVGTHVFDLQIFEDGASFRLQPL